ncbi:uncharacterized protein LOC111124850 isoform X2 [Crassostrea virginica]
MAKNGVQTIDEAWRTQMETLCASFQKSQGEMIIVARQPLYPLFACCTSKVRRQMMRHFSTFRECLKISKHLGSPSVKPCCLCFNIPEKEDVRDCEAEDVWSALGIKVLRGGKVCVDCSDNLHKFLYFKKKITEIHLKKKLPKKSKSDIATQSSVRNKVSKGFRGQEGVGGQAVKESVEGQEHHSEVDALFVEMTDSTEEGDQNEDKSYNQKKNSQSRDTTVQSEAKSLLDIMKKTISKEKSRKHSKDKTAEGASTTCITSTTTVSSVGPGVMKSETNANNRALAESVITAQTLNKTTSETCQPLLAISDVRSLRSGGDSKTNSQFPGISKALISSSQDQSMLSFRVNMGRLGPVDIQAMPVLRAPISSTVPPNKMATPPTTNIKTEVGSTPTPQETPHSMVMFGDSKGHYLVQQPPSTKGFSQLAKSEVIQQPPLIGSVPPANSEVIIQPPPFESAMLANNQVLIQPPAMFPQIRGALMLAPKVGGAALLAPGGGATALPAPGGRATALPAPISSSSSKMQKTTSYVPIQSKKPQSPGTLPAPQENSVCSPSITKSVNPTLIPVSPKLSNLEESKEKAVVAFKNAVLSQVAPLPSPMPSAFILALPKSLETSTPNIQIITNPTSTYQSKTTTPLVVPSTAKKLAEQGLMGLMPLKVNDVSSKYSPQGHSSAASLQTVVPPHVTTEQENPSSHGNSSFIKIGKMTYQLEVKNNQQLFVPSLPQLTDKPSSSFKENNFFDSRKRKLTFPNPEKVYVKRMKSVSPQFTNECFESESDPEEIEVGEDRKVARLEEEVTSSAPIPSSHDHDYTLRQGETSFVRCKYCVFRASYWKTMAGHMRKHHLKRYCIKCNNFLKYSFVGHTCKRNAQSKSRTHVCLVCSKLNDNAVNLYKHYQEHHETEIEQEGHCHSLYSSVRPQNIFICKGCLRVELSEHNMLCHVKKEHMCDGEEDPNSQLLQKNEPVCVCPVCWLHFPEKKFLDFHIEVFHIEKLGTGLVCHLCSKCFTSKSDLIDHYSTHWCDIKYRCGICRQQLDPMSSLEELRSHRNALHPTNSLSPRLLCPIENCEKTFQEDIEFLQHITQHELKNKFTQKCSKCVFTATSTTLMTKHEDRFHYEPDKRCTVCMKRLKTPEALTAHMDRHINKRKPEQFICEQCGKLSSQLRLHNQHMKKHKNPEKPKLLYCQVCGKKYTWSRNLSLHILRRHPEVKQDRLPEQFPCIYCDYVTFRSLSIHHHMMSHKKLKPYMCKFCEKCFREKEKYTIHLKQHKEGRIHRIFRCFVCHLDREGVEMRNHLNTESHKLNCQLGGLNFEDYNKDLLQLFPSKVTSTWLERKIYAEKSLKAECGRVHEEHCKRAKGQIEGEERSYTVYTPEGEELLIELPAKHQQCPECGLLFKTNEQLAEHKESVRNLELATIRNEFHCQVCDIYLFGRLSVAEHARCQHHVDMCRDRGVRPEDILDVNKIPRNYYDRYKKEDKTSGYKCKVCDVFFITKKSKIAHISKPGHVEKCQELGLDPADGDRFEDNSHKKKMLKKKKQDRPKPMKKPKVKGEKTINRLVKKLFTINLLGVEVPRNIAFSCLVCDITVSNRVQAIDHLHTPRHIVNCEDKGTLSGPGNLCLQLKMEDYASVVGKTVSQVLGLPSDAVFPLNDQEKTSYRNQIQEAEAASGGKTKKIKGGKKSAQKCIPVNVDPQPLLSPGATGGGTSQITSASTLLQSLVQLSTDTSVSENLVQPSMSSSNVAIPVSLYQ